MEIVVLVKYVPDAEAERGLAGPNLLTDRSTVDGLLSELDEYAVEEALRLTEAHGGTVTAVTMGPAEAETALRAAFQFGADTGVHVLDDALAGSDAVATSLVLASVVRRLEPDLVLTGMASTDGGTSTVPAMIAERLGWPQLTFADTIEVEGQTIRTHRDRDQYTEVIEADLPALAGVTDRINEPRYPTFRAILAAKKKTVQVLSLADLDLPASAVGLAGARTTIEAVAPLPARGSGQVIEDQGDGGIRLADYLCSVGFS